MTCYLSEAALADDLEDLVAVGDVVMRHLDVGALVVVVAAVVGSAHHPRPLLGVGTHKVNCRDEKIDYDPGSGSADRRPLT